MQNIILKKHKIGKVRKRTKLDAQTDGEWWLSTRPLEVVNMALTTTNGLV